MGTGQALSWGVINNNMMIGLELKLNDQTVVASIENGVTSIFLSKIDDVIRLDFRGTDNHKNQHVTWSESCVNEDDQIKIKVVTVDKVTDVLYSYVEEVDSWHNKLIEYNAIKEYLEKEGLILKDD